MNIHEGNGLMHLPFNSSHKLMAYRSIKYLKIFSQTVGQNSK